MVERSTISGNAGHGVFGGGGLYDGSSCFVRDSTIDSNSNGGLRLANYSFDGSSLDVSNTTVSGNLFGIALNSYQPSSVRIVNSTIVGNTANREGTGIFVNIFTESDMRPLLQNSIVADNSNEVSSSDLSGTFAADYNVIKNPGSSSINESVPGSNLIGVDPMLGPLQDNGGPTLTHALLTGSPAIDRGDPAFVPPPDFDQRGDGYPRVINGRLDMGAFEVQSGAVPAGRAWLRPLGDINRDGTPEIVVVAEGDGGSRATVKDAASGTLVSQFDLGADLLPVDVEVMDDSGYGSLPAANLAVLGKDSARADTRDVLSGDLLGSVAFNASLTPLDLTVLPDQDGNGNPELGMLAEGATRVEIRDALTGDSINNLWFAPRFDPLQVITLPDLNRNGSAEVGVVLVKADETDRLVIKDTRSGANVNTVGTWWEPQLDLLQALPVTDAVGNATANVAMLLRDPITGKILVRIANARTNVTAATVRGYNSSFAPVKLVQVADINGNGLDEYALLARNPDTGQVTAELRDGDGGVSRMWFSSECTPLDLETIDDINDNGAQELVMLGRCGVEGTLRATVKDAKTGETLNRMSF